ncbi:MAG: hypothetical protein IKO06_01710 [Alphaproteobacteria bacterium]|nr:hypothetical protein [Alphaproteobacteria bacterium]
MNKKDLLKSLMFLFKKKRRKSHGKNISAAEAIDIQNKYMNISCPIDAPIAPPYVEIAKQLYSPKQEVFVAALFYLEQIALNEKSHNSAIVGLLQKFSVDEKLPQSQKTMVMQTLERIS